MQNLKKTFRQNREARAIAGFVAGTSVIGLTALMLSVPVFSSESTETPEIVATTPETPPPSWSRTFPPAPAAEEEEIEVTVTHETVVDVEEPLRVEVEGPVLALEHDTPDHDFLAAAEQFLADEDPRSAFAALRRHLYANPPTPEVLHRLGRLGRELKERAIAERALVDATELNPEDAELFTELARVRLEAGELKTARTAVETAIRLDPQDPLAWNVRGRIAMTESEWHQAVESFDEAIQLDPGSAIAYNNAGLNFIYMKRGYDAVDMLETAVELYGEQAPHFVFNNLGLAHELAGNYEEAREAFEEALLLSPFYARAKVNLGRVEQTIASIEQEKAFETAREATLEPEPLSDDT